MEESGADKVREGDGELGLETPHCLIKEGIK